MHIELRLIAISNGRVESATSYPARHRSHLALAYPNSSNLELWCVLQNTQKEPIDP